MRASGRRTARRASSQHRTPLPWSFSYVREELGEVVTAAASAPGASAADVVGAATAAAPLHALRKFVAIRTAGSTTHGGVCIQTAAVQTFLRELRGMPLHAAVSAALQPATPRSRHVDEVLAINCYNSGQGCCPTGSDGAAAAAEAQRREQRGDACALGAAQPWEAQQAQRGAEAAPPREASAAAFLASHSSGSLADTAAASSSPALAASAAEPAVKEDLTVERVCMLLLTAPGAAWRGLPSEALRADMYALLDTSMHSGARQRALGPPSPPAFWASQGAWLPCWPAARSAPLRNSPAARCRRATTCGACSPLPH